MSVYRRPLKVVVAGDASAGKTELIISYVTGEFPNEYVPTVFDNYAGSVVVEGEVFTITLWDTAGQREYEEMRPISYPGTDVALVCFSLTNRAGFQNVKTKWVPEIRKHCGENIPIILVGNKSDKRTSPHSNSDTTISHFEGMQLASELGLSDYKECSAKTREGLEEVFVSAVRAVIRPKSHRKRKESCAIM